MKYEALIDDVRIYKGLIPEYLCEIIARQDVVLYGGLEDSDGTDVLVSLAAFSFSAQHKNEARLEYLYVMEEERGKGYAEELLAFCTGRLKQAGIRIINCKLCDADIALGNLLRKERYIPISFTGHLLEYPIQGFFEREVFSRIPTGKGAGVFTAGDCDEGRMRRFLARTDIDKCYMDKGRFDGKYNRFFNEDGEIKACILMEQTDEHTLFLSNAYTSFDCRQKAAYVFLLADALKEAAKSMPEDTIVKIQTFSKKEYYFLHQIHKDCKKDYRIEEYVKWAV